MIRLTARCVPALLLPLVLFSVSPRAQSAEPIELRAGPLTTVFDADNAFLRYIKAGPYEVLRGINAPVRNKEWGTVLPEISNLQVDDHGDHFEVAFDATCREGEVDFRWQGKITGSSAGEVEFTFDGVAESTFLRNRIGFCVLHSPSAAGKPWVIHHTDGRRTEGSFPGMISPHQPAKEIQAIAHRLAPELWAHVEFEGDVFEMEDQRNWTDASFKTYCTPLERPYPVEVKKGTTISQKIRFHVEGEVPMVRADDGPVVLAVKEHVSPLPRIGLQVSSESTELSPRQINRLRALQLDHLRVDLELSAESVAARFDRARRQANDLGVKLHVGVHSGEDADSELEELIGLLTEASSEISQVLILNSDQETFARSRTRLATAVGDVQFGLGNDTNFVDLNRNRPTTEDFDVGAFAINPQIHAFDNASMVETLPIQGITIVTAREFLSNRPLSIGPITLRPQGVLGGPLSGALPSDVDSRQPTPFAAAWTLGSLKFLAEAGVDSATYFETVGWKGVMDLDEPKSRLGAFPSTPRAVFAMYHVLRDVGEFAGGEVQHVASSDNLSVIGFMLKNGSKRRMLIANLTDKEQTVTVWGLSTPLKATIVHDAEWPKLNMRPEAGIDQVADREIEHMPFVLPSHALARIDLIEEDL